MRKSIYSHDYRVFLLRLRAARETAGLSQGQLARRLKATQSFVSKCERGERRLDLIEARTWCAALGVRFREFVAGLEEELQRG